MKAGKPANTDEDMTEIDNPTLQLLELPVQPPPPPEEIEFVMQEPTTNKHDEITSISASLENIEIPPIPHSPPPGYKWQYHQCLVPVDTKDIQSCKSFEQCFLDVVKRNERRPKQSRKRLKVSSCVVTDQALVAELERDEEDRRQKEEDKLRRKEKT